MSKRTIERLRKALTPFVGCDIDVDANVGRKRIVPYEGVLENTYPNGTNSTTVRMTVKAVLFKL